MICYALTGDMGEPNLKEKANPLFETPAFNVSCLSLPGTIKSITGIDEAAIPSGNRRSYGSCFRRNYYRKNERFACSNHNKSIRYSER